MAETCIGPGCNRTAVNNLGVRLRKPPQADAWWSPNANAYVCNVHAKSGARITLIYEATRHGESRDARFRRRRADRPANRNQVARRTPEEAKWLRMQ
jgi:hypothetical protein